MKAKITIAQSYGTLNNQCLQEALNAYFQGQKDLYPHRSQFKNNVPIFTAHADWYQQNIEQLSAIKNLVDKAVRLTANDLPEYYQGKQWPKAQSMGVLYAYESHVLIEGQRLENNACQSYFSVPLNQQGLMKIMPTVLSKYAEVLKINENASVEDLKNAIDTCIFNGLVPRAAHCLYFDASADPELFNQHPLTPERQAFLKSHPHVLRVMGCDDGDVVMRFDSQASMRQALQLVDTLEQLMQFDYEVLN